VHVVGTEELKIAGTPVYIDVEGVPDRDFYYLIGLRIGADPAAIQHSLWADAPEDEEEIWHRLIDLVSVVHDPIIIHYVGFETAFLKRMRERYGGPYEESVTGQALTNSINVLSFIFARIYSLRIRMG